MLDFTSALASRRLLLDADGVLLNWFEGFAAFASRELGVPLDPATLQSYSMSLWLGEHKHRALELIESFNGSDTHGFGQLRPVPGAVEAITDMHASGFELHVITSCTEDPMVAMLREQNLRNVFGDVFEDIACLPMNADKQAHLEIHPPSVWIDDHWPNLDAGRAAGHLPVLFDACYNQQRADGGPDDYLRLQGWSALPRLLQREPALAPIEP